MARLVTPSTAAQIVSAVFFVTAGCSQSDRLPSDPPAHSATKISRESNVATTQRDSQIDEASEASEAADLQGCDDTGWNSAWPENSGNEILRFAGTDSQLNGQTQLGWKPAAPPRSWKYIVLHHTAVNRGSVESIHKLHRARKDSKGNPWLGIGYHFVIGNGNGMRDGLAEPTFRWTKQMHGAHAGHRMYNEFGIGITLVGNFEERPPTDAQLKTARRLVAFLRETYKIPVKNIIGHGDIKNTACPGRHFSIAAVTHGASTSLLSDSPSQGSLAKRKTVAQPSRPAETQE